MKKSTNEQTKSVRPFGLELLETVSEADLNQVSGGIGIGGGFQTEHVSIPLNGKGKPDYG